MTPKRSEFRCLDRLRVRWSEVDLQKIVFNGHYLMYFDTAVAAYWRALALPYHDTMAQLEGDIFVRKATLEYEASARYEDLLEVGVRCSRIGNSSMVFAAAVFRGEQVLVHGELVYVFADPATQTSKPVPPLLREWLLGFDAGQAMLETRLGAWTELGSLSQALRQAVFVVELGAPSGLAAEPADQDAVHAVLLNRAGLAVAVGRLLPAIAGVGQIGRIATLSPLRGTGLGKTVLSALVDAGARRGDAAAMLYAAPGAVAFYEHAGFARTGETFEEAGVLHVQMRRDHAVSVGSA
jgi:YbgC/YbaW family acyl-CoA thioester hydrolase